MLKVVQENNESNRDEPNGVGVSLIDEIVRDGGRQMLMAALQAAVAPFVDAHASEVDVNGRRLVVRNGSHGGGATGGDVGGRSAGASTTGQRQTCRSGHW